MPDRLQDVRNFRAADDKLVTCGQPTEQQLAAAREAGLEVVINLALHDDPRYSLADERGTVEALGMTYVHIPVKFGAPAESDLLAFFDAMESSQGRQLLVHCAANYRVTAFLGLYRRIKQGWSRDDAFQLMGTVWQADAVWAQFIDAMLAKHADPTSTDFFTSRVVNAPRAEVFRAFTEPALLARWWGPEGFTNTFEEFELRAGGTWRFDMHGPDGSHTSINNEFVEIAPLQRIVLRHIQPEHMFQIALTFTDVDGGTRVDWRTEFESAAQAGQVRSIWDGLTEQNLDRLEALVRNVAQ